MTHNEIDQLVKGFIIDAAQSAANPRVQQIVLRLVSDLFKAIEDLNINDKEKEVLVEIEAQFELDSDKIRDMRNNAFQSIYNLMLADGKLDSAERTQINNLLEALSIPRNTAITDTKADQKAVIIGYLEEGKFPPIETPNEISLDENELFRWAQAAAMVKFKKVVTRVNYSGLNYRIKITKGLSYRIGSIKPQAITQETLSQEDAGILWLTDQKIAYRGSRKHFEITFSKIEHIEYDEGVLKIFKTGKLNPYLILLHDYEIVIKMTSMLI
jgi:hypothetical protein